MQLRPLCILVTGEPVAETQARAGGFAALVRARLGASWSGGFEELDARTAERLPEPERFSGLIVTGSASSVTERADWILRAERYLAGAAESGQPVLGICFGHQLLGQGLGGLVERNPRGREMGTVRLELLQDDALLDSGIEPALVHTTHLDSVTILPKSARLLARTALEPNAVVRFGERAWGVQFHPEFDPRVMAEYVAARRSVLAGEGIDPDLLAAGIVEADAGSAILRRFVEQGVLAR